MKVFASAAFQFLRDGGCGTGFDRRVGVDPEQVAIGPCFAGFSQPLGRLGFVFLRPARQGDVAQAVGGV